ncbi:3-hydroxyisobutyrate dehydrogenase-like beta-hydroxyacid dehydrogenase [Rhodoglobus vestalii]|uniref:3-hydroxyisobutyrate dehydrogenase-like beta-hydroxyacid dehydrogenase n=1 Tax=Rhodoglobus vestalii TaxID=193384 RepID=A0A8H2PZC8_9MICO|nr:DUF1932 domain-containing protein [Rhodoglobus vestalii]TQO20573.1 3-hydroxyisobutyrate dehydrogenase-like beta-hydroxyacid dehydrogenase [Rhodoglobus vestalii]
MSPTLKVAVIGHGEAGSLIAGGLQDAGLVVIGFDPATPANPTVPLTASVNEAVAGADIVLSLNSSTVAFRVAEQVAPMLKEGVIYADLNTGTPALKKKLAALFASGAFADVAIMRPVPGLGAKVPMGVSGTAARRFVDLLEPFALNLEFVSDVAGEAAARKLIRSVLAKGIAAVTIDYLWAAESLGLQEWAYEEVQREFDAMSAETAQRYLSGTVKHVKRRQIEMIDVNEMLNESGYLSTIVPAIELTYNRVIHSVKVPFSTPEK